MDNRFQFFDVIKGIAILGVVLFHIGLLNYGYLGVDVFLVISGYLTTISLLKYKSMNRSNYSNFIKRRITRLAPMSLIAIAISLFICYFVMAPTDFKLCSEMVVGSSIFMGNVVQYITSRDYWDSINDFKPLMHLWYVGLIFQFYILFPIIFIVKNSKNRGGRMLELSLWIIFIASIAFYLIPIGEDEIDTSVKFYLLPARLFEFVAGSIVAFNYRRDKACNSLTKYVLLILIALILIISINFEIDAKKIRLIIAVALTTGLLILKERDKRLLKSYKLPAIAKLGVASYSIYIFHQVVIALYRYIVNYDFSITEYLGLFFMSIIIGLICYKYIEKPLSDIAHTKKGSNYIIIISIVLAIILLAAGSYVYNKKGVVRDVPQLNIYKNNPSEWEPQLYNECIIKYDKDFPANGRKNILVFGDSYGRDWINIMLESNIDTTKYNISYHGIDVDSSAIARVKKANVIFVANANEMKVFYYMLPYFYDKKFWRVGYKKYYSSIGPMYNNIFRDKNYYNRHVVEPERSREINDIERKLYRSRYIDMMGVLKNKDGEITVFTPNHKFISHDGLHLTKEGAKYYAKKLNVKKYLGED